MPTGSPKLLVMRNPFAGTAGLPISPLYFAVVNDVSKMATGGDGTSGNPWTGWEFALNALQVKSRIHFPYGFYTQVTRIEVLDGWHISGDGKFASKVTSAFTGSAFRIATGANVAANLATTTSHVTIRDLWISNSNAANVGSAIVMLTGRMNAILDVQVTGFRYGLPLINSQVINIERCTFDSQLRGGVWIVNGGDYNLTYADIDYSAGPIDGSNVINVNGCQFNNLATAGIVGVINDGGLNHNFRGNNFNGCYYAFYLSGIVDGFISAGDHELQGSHIVYMANQTFNSGTALGGGGSLNGTITLQDNTWHPTSTNACVYPSATVQQIILIGNRGIGNSAMVQNAQNGVVCLLNIGSNMSGVGDVYDTVPIKMIDLNGKSTHALRLSSGITINEFGNGRAGVATLVAGTVTVANTSVTASTRVLTSRQALGGTAGQLSVTLNAGVGFTINSSAGADTSVIYYELREP